MSAEAYPAVDAGATAVSLNGGYKTSWYTAHKTISDANNYVNNGSNSSGFNNLDTETGNFDWSLLKYTFTVPLTAQGAATKTIKFDFVFYDLKGKISLDGFGIVAGDKVPTDEAMYSEDIDKDGIKNINDTDMDGDGILNINDADANGDGVDDATDADIDKDGTINKYDPDIDGDGIRNIFDKDIDGDYILNKYDRTPMGCVVG